MLSPRAVQRGLLKSIGGTVSSVRRRWPQGFRSQDFCRLIPQFRLSVVGLLGLEKVIRMFEKSGIGFNAAVRTRKRGQSKVVRPLKVSSRRSGPFGLISRVVGLCRLLRPLDELD